MGGSKLPYLKKFLSHALVSLSKSQRQIIKMTFWEDKSLVEQAYELKTTKQAVCNMKRRALKKLKSKILSMVEEMEDKKNSNKTNVQNAHSIKKEI